MGTSGDKIVLLDGMGSGSGSLRNVKDIMSGRMRCTVRDGLASVTSVTSTMVRNLICVEVGEVVTTEEQTLMTRIISGI